MSGLTRFDFPEPEPFGAGLILGVRHIDTFGNIGLNLTREQFLPFAAQGFQVCIGQTEITGHYDTYGTAPENVPFLVTDSAGFMEIAVKNGHAASQLGICKQDKVVLTVLTAGKKDMISENGE